MRWDPALLFYGDYSPTILRESMLVEAPGPTDTNLH